MGVFSRFKDIISSNINAMLDKAEDPEKMIRLMIQEMEETLVELKASCAATIAERMKLQRELADTGRQIALWQQRAGLAVSKGREDLAREALLEKQRCEQGHEEVTRQQDKLSALIEQSHNDIARLEEKIVTARKKQRLLVQRHIHAQQKYRSESTIRKAASADAVLKFEQFEQRVDRMEAAADLVNPSPRAQEVSLEQQFAHLENNDAIEKELAALKDSLAKDK